MSNRIINIHDGPNGGPPKKPIQMEDILNDAQRDWLAGRKNEAIVKILGGMAMMSKGVGQAIKVSELAMQQVDEIKAKLPKE